MVPPVPIAVVRELCRRSGCKIVFNTLHNAHNGKNGQPPPIEQTAKAVGWATYLHDEPKTQFCQKGGLARAQGVSDWLARHPGTEWVGFDDAAYTKAPNLILVESNIGLHVDHLNRALAFWKLPQVDILQLKG